MRLPWRRGDRASSLDLLVVGLGNPGREYARNLLGRLDSLVTDFQKNPKKYINVQFRVF